MNRASNWMVAALAALGLTGAATATPVAFSYTGSATSLSDVMYEAGDGAGGSGVFAAAGFGAQSMNIFVVDFSGSQNLGAAGVTVFAMWGNGDALPYGFAAGAQIFGSTYMEAMDDGGYGYDYSLSGAPQIFGLGSNVNVGQDHTIAVDVEFGWDAETPRAFVVTNVDSMDEGILSIQFDYLVGSIDHFDGFSAGQQGPMEGERGWSGDSFDIPLEAHMPLPTPIALAALGLAGVVLIRRRI